MTALDHSQAGAPRALLDVAWRVLVVALVFGILSLPLTLMSARPSPVTSTAVGLVTGAGYAVVVIPLARRLAYRRRTRFLAVFVLLYWIGLLSNLVEAGFDTTISRPELAGGAVILAIPIAAASWTVAWLLPARETKQPLPPISRLLSQRSVLSWAWRILVAGLLFAVVLQLAGTLWGPVIARYYHDPTYMAQTQTITPPGYVAWPEEVARGILFVLVLLPLLAVMRGRDWRSLLVAAAYIALLDAVIEGWLPMLAQTSWPLQFRLGEGADLTTDALARGVFVALLLALPAFASGREMAGEPSVVLT
jgi:hypothetical protein